ncbi:hypothetical protein HPB51_007852 [Rhipicephalus microplus]|uniref:Tc1-like transposase DDE domain-containing protein n=1 Tax=Rhipicephalus microplus TaxID=6941 RepID=A0A9J6EME1_RHIMP|nr:hypothetical protein HPB51_007852 [Rhipicephalus microplus]
MSKDAPCVDEESASSPNGPSKMLETSFVPQEYVSTSSNVGMISTVANQSEDATLQECSDAVGEGPVNGFINVDKANLARQGGRVTWVVDSDRETGGDEALAVEVAEESPVLRPLRVSIEVKKCGESCHPSVPTNWGISDRDHAGRSRCTGDDVDRLIIAAVVADPHITEKGMKDALLLNASLCTIRRRLAEAGRANCIMAQKPHITDRQKSMRPQFGRSVQAWGSEEWGKFVLSDKSTFSSRWDQERYSPQYTQSVFASGRCSLSVWATMTREGLVPLILIDGNLSASSYSIIIERELLPYVLNRPFKDGCFVYQHDRSPIHTARSVKSLLEDLAVRTLEWPPVGVDLNPIENVWGLVKRRLAARNLGSSTKGTPFAAIQEEWEALRSRPEIVATLYNSMPSRVAQVIAADKILKVVIVPGLQL